MSNIKLTAKELELIRERAEECGTREVKYSLQGTGQLMALLEDLKELKEKILWDYPQVDLLDVMYDAITDEDYGFEIEVSLEIPDNGEQLFKEFCEDEIRNKEIRYDNYLRLKEEFEDE